VDLLGRYSNQEFLHRSLTRALDPGLRGQPERRSRERKQAQTRLTDDQIDALIVAYEDGLTREDLASAFAIDRLTAARHLERHGVSRRGRKLTDEQVAEAAELYEAGWSLSRIGEKYGVWGQSVRYRLRKAGVQMRPRNGSM